jgi:hypothetical protein
MSKRSPIVRPKKKPAKHNHVVRPQRGRGKATTGGKREERRKEVRRLRMRNLSKSAIAKALGVSALTIGKDLEIITKENIERAVGSDQNAYIGDSISLFEEVEAQAWQDYEGVAVGHTNRAKFLDVIRNSRKDAINLKQNLGLLYKEPDKKSVRATVELDWAPQVKQLVSDAILEQHLKGSLPEPEPMVLEAEEIEEDN